MGTRSDAFDALVRAHWREVVSLLTAITGQVAMAEDLAQETFLLAWRRNLHAGPAARCWFRRAARYLALNELRRRRPSVLDPDDVADAADAAAMRMPAAVDDTPFEERLAALRFCMGALNASDRRLIAERYETRRPLGEVSVAEGQTVGYLKQRLFRLRRRLAECIRARMALGPTPSDNFPGTGHIQETEASADGKERDSTADPRFSGR
jgi:RNA polymerase sigma-70 factor (ECF subfamily)